MATDLRPSDSQRSCAIPMHQNSRLSPQHLNIASGQEKPESERQQNATQTPHTPPLSLYSNF